MDAFANVPDELILHILYYLTLQTHDLSSPAAVSKRFYRLCMDQTLWHNLFCEIFPSWASAVGYLPSLSNVDTAKTDWRALLLGIKSSRHRISKNLNFDFAGGSDILFDEHQEEEEEEEEEDSHSVRKRRRVDPETSLSSSSILWYPPNEPQTTDTTDEYEDLQLSTTLPETYSSSLPASSSSFLSDMIPYNLSAHDVEVTATNLRNRYPFLPNPDDDTPPPLFKYTDPLLCDVDRFTRTGMVATGKHRLYRGRAQHRIKFWEYPSWEPLPDFDVFQEQDRRAQIVGLQTVDIPVGLPGNRVGVVRKRIFSVAIGFALQEAAHEDESDRVDVWTEFRVYEVSKRSDKTSDGKTGGWVVTYLGRYQVESAFLGREVFIIGEDTLGVSNRTRKEWEAFCPPGPKLAEGEERYQILMLGASVPEIRGAAVMVTMTYDRIRRRTLVNTVLERTFGNHLSCMHHIRHPRRLRHLLLTGSTGSEDLLIWDLRTGGKVGWLPGTAATAMNGENNEHGAAGNESEDDNDDDQDLDDNSMIPWGLESTMVVPPRTPDEEGSGFRLIAVGDNRNDKLEIRVWDISHLLEIPYSVFDDHNNRANNGTKSLCSRSSTDKVPTLHLSSKPTSSSHSLLPLSPPSLKTYKPLLILHAFPDHLAGLASSIPVKYTAYNVMSTFLFMLTDTGEMVVLDVERGEIVRVLENIAPASRRVHGVDVNVVGHGEVVVTTREGILRGFVV